MNNIDQVACDSAREIMELVSGKMPVGGLPQLQAMVQNIVAEAMRSGNEPVDIAQRPDDWLFDECVNFLKYGTSGCKYSDALVWCEDDDKHYAVWEPAESLGLVDVVGSYKWRRTEKLNKMMNGVYDKYALEMVEILRNSPQD